MHPKYIKLPRTVNGKELLPIIDELTRQNSSAIRFESMVQVGFEPGSVKVIEVQRGVWIKRHLSILKRIFTFDFLTYYDL